jgi:putative solute:sodium symporter small subunit
MKKDLSQYWKKNLTLMVILLSIWATVSYGCGILFVEQLNAIKIGGFPLGFWFAQQGAIYTFVCLIFTYYVIMKKVDEEFDVDE